MLNRRPVLAAALMLLPVSSAMACNTPTDLCINEVQTYGTGSPTARRATQYIELRGPAGATIAAGHYLVAVDGDRNQNPGTIDVVLEPCSFHLATDEGQHRCREHGPGRRPDPPQAERSADTAQRHLCRAQIIRIALQ